MKFGFYSLTVVLLAGLGLTLPLSRADLAREAATPAPARPATGRIVFVDREALVRSHPAWEALQEMRMTLSQVRAAPRVDSQGSPISFAAPDPLAVCPSAGVPGQQLEAEVASRAVRSLGEVESAMRLALAARLASMRADAAASIDAGLELESREIIAAAERAAADVERERAADILNARLKVGALTAAAKSPVVDSGSVQLKLFRAQEALSDMQKSSLAESERIKTAARASVDALRDERNSQAQARLYDYETQEIYRIESRMVAARDEILGDLGSATASAERAPSVRFQQRLSGRAAAPRSEASATRPPTDALASTASRLELRIRQDIDRIIRKLAAARQMKVIFDRSAGADDLTTTFAGLMRTAAWQTCAPVLVGAGGS